MQVVGGSRYRTRRVPAANPPLDAAKTPYRKRVHARICKTNVDGTRQPRRPMERSPSTGFTRGGRHLVLTPRLLDSTRRVSILDAQRGRSRDRRRNPMTE